MNIVNLTPHAISIQTRNAEILSVPPSGEVARCVEVRTDAPDVNGIAVSKAEYGEVTGLPDPQPDTIFVVSSLVLAAVGDQRADVFAPGPAIRDDQGRIIGCQGLSCGAAYIRHHEAKAEYQPQAQTQTEGVSTIPCCTINRGYVEHGIRLVDGKIAIGQEGRGRKLVMVPLPEGAVIDDDEVIALPGPGVVVTIRDHSGYRGTWTLVGANGDPVSPETLGELIAAGVCAQGDAGRMGGGPEYLIRFKTDAEFMIRRYGRLYGKPALFRVRVTAASGNVKVTNAEAEDAEAEAARRLASN